MARAAFPFSEVIVVANERREGVRIYRHTSEEGFGRYEMREVSLIVPAYAPVVQRYLDGGERVIIHASRLTAPSDVAPVITIVDETRQLYCAAVTPGFMRVHARECMEAEQGEMLEREGYWDETRFLEDFRQGTGTYLAGKWELSEAVLDRDGRVVGYLIGIYANRDYPFAGSNALFVFRLAVHPEYRGMRLGPTLLHRFAQKAVERHIPVVALETWEHNTVAQSVYERAGFVKTGQQFYPSKGMVLYQYAAPSQVLYEQTLSLYDAASTDTAYFVTGQSS
jgi:ribosomal protein S18 acetylase RimI-like enzyme